MISFISTSITINFSPLKRVVKGHCSRHLRRGSIPTKPEKVKCKCTRASEQERKECDEDAAGYTRRRGGWPIEPDVEIALHQLLQRHAWTGSDLRLSSRSPPASLLGSSQMCMVKESGHLTT